MGCTGPFARLCAAGANTWGGIVRAWLTALASLSVGVACFIEQQSGLAPATVLPPLLRASQRRGSAVFAMGPVVPLADPGADSHSGNRVDSWNPCVCRASQVRLARLLSMPHPSRSGKKHRIDGGHREHH